MRTTPERINPLRRAASIALLTGVGAFACMPVAAASVEKPSPTTTTPRPSPGTTAEQKPKIGTGIKGGKKPAAPKAPKNKKTPQPSKSIDTNANSLMCVFDGNEATTPKKGTVSLGSIITKEVVLYGPGQKKMKWGKSGSMSMTSATKQIADNNPSIPDITQPGNSVTLKLPSVCEIIVVQRVQEPLTDGQSDILQSVSAPEPFAPIINQGEFNG